MSPESEQVWDDVPPSTRLTVLTDAIAGMLRDVAPDVRFVVILDLDDAESFVCGTNTPEPEDAVPLLYSAAARIIEAAGGELHMIQMERKGGQG